MYRKIRTGTDKAFGLRENVKQRINASQWQCRVSKRIWTPSPAPQHLRLGTMIVCASTYSIAITVVRVCVSTKLIDIIVMQSVQAGPYLMESPLHTNDMYGDCSSSLTLAVNWPENSCKLLKNTFRFRNPFGPLHYSHWTCCLHKTNTPIFAAAGKSWRLQWRWTRKNEFT